MAVLALALLAGGYALLPHGERIAAGISVNGVTLGGQTREQARAAVEASLRREAERSITLAAASERRELTLAAMGIRPDAENTLVRAYGVGRQGAITCRLSQALAARRHGVAVAPTFTLDPAVATGVLNELGRAIERPAADATASWDESAKRVVVIPGVSGGTLDIDASLDLIMSSTVSKLAAGEPVPAEVALPGEVNAPRVTAEMLAPVDTLLGAFTTSYAGSSRNRAGNIETAARAIDGMVIMPGGEFSYNKTVGPRDRESGFRLAPVIVNGQLQPGIGGGICQVSTTLYNAALLSNMKIEARSHHSHPVPYVPSGRDATVVYGAIDLKFRNTTDAPIVIEMHTAKRRLTARILGKGPALVVKIERSGIRRLGKRTVTKKDPKLPLGARAVEQRGSSGLAVTVTRVIGNGAAAVREVVSRDRYIGEPSIVRIGTGAPASVPTDNSTGSATISSMSGLRNNN
jgi:vancomycin resistance protein YoaR